MLGGQLDPVQLGDVLMGRYRIDGLLGHGGMGQVYVATHLKLRRRVAIKVLHPRLATRSDLVRRFEREARAAASISNDHVARVTDVDVTEAGSPFMVMELLEGTDLGDLVARWGKIPIGVAARWIAEAARGVSAAHDLGIVHRDLKPANLFLARMPEGPPRIKVLDFGISKWEEPGEATLTVGGLVGSPAYMAPEQHDGGAVDRRGDVWALGVTLFELLTGTLPFSGKSAAALCNAVMHAKPVDPRSLREEVPAELAAVIERCLAKLPKDRYASAEDLASALQPFASNEEWLPAEPEEEDDEDVALKATELDGTPPDGHVTEPITQTIATDKVTPAPPLQVAATPQGTTTNASRALAGFLALGLASAVGVAAWWTMGHGHEAGGGEKIPATAAPEDQASAKASAPPAAEVRVTLGSMNASSVTGIATSSDTFAPPPIASATGPAATSAPTAKKALNPPTHASASLGSSTKPPPAAATSSPATELPLK